jgi:uncharacterized repeat protein (TIGR02543 family)
VITLDANGGSVSPNSISFQVGGAPVTLPTPSRSGFTFNGWFTQSSGGTLINSPYTPSASIVLYAQWTEIVNVGLNMVYLGEATSSSTIGDLGSNSVTTIYDALGFNNFTADGRFPPYYPKNSTNSLVLTNGTGPLRFNIGLAPCRIDLWAPTFIPTAQEIWDGKSYGTGSHIEGSAITAFGSWTTSYTYTNGATLYWSTSAKCLIP